MNEVVLPASWVVAGAGIVLAALVFAVMRRVSVALPVLLDMLMAAGLLRLSAEAPWRAIATAGAIVVLRKLVVAGLQVHSAPEPADHAG
jgi:hypothetical protein